MIALEDPSLLGTSCWVYAVQGSYGWNGPEGLLYWKRSCFQKECAFDITPSEGRINSGHGGHL